MVKKLGIIFSGLLILLLLSNTNYYTNILVLGQNASIINPSNTTNSTSSNITKLHGGIQIIFPDKGGAIPLNANTSLVIQGVSKDNSTSDCDVSIIINNVKPYQNVQPAGMGGENDFSNWQYTVSSNYTTFNEGNNKITSKIYCLIDSQPSQAYYSVNVTASNFTAAQLDSYNTMIEQGNLTNSSQTSNLLQQPVAQIQQFNLDTGNGPICCQAVSTSGNDGGSSGGSSGGSNDDDDSSSSSRDDDDDSSSSSRDDDDDDDDSNDTYYVDDSSSSSSSSSRDDDDDDDDSNDTYYVDDSSSSSSSSRDDDDDSNDTYYVDDSSSSSSSSRDDDDDSNDNSNFFNFPSRSDNFDFDFDFDNDRGSDDSDDQGSSSDFDFDFDNDRGSDDSFGSNVDSILDNVENNLKASGIDFSFG